MRHGVVCRATRPPGREHTVEVGSSARQHSSPTASIISTLTMASKRPSTLVEVAQQDTRHGSEARVTMRRWALLLLRRLGDGQHPRPALRRPDRQLTRSGAEFEELGAAAYLGEVEQPVGLAVLRRRQEMLLGREAAGRARRSASASRRGRARTARRRGTGAGDRRTAGLRASAGAAWERGRPRARRARSAHRRDRGPPTPPPYRTHPSRRGHRRRSCGEGGRIAHLHKGSAPADRVAAEAHPCGRRAEHMPHTPSGRGRPQSGGLGQACHIGPTARGDGRGRPGLGPGCRGQGHAQFTPSWGAGLHWTWRRWRRP